MIKSHFLHQAALEEPFKVENQLFHHRELSQSPHRSHNLQVTRYQGKISRFKFLRNKKPNSLMQIKKMFMVPLKHPRNNSTKH